MDNRMISNDTNFTLNHLPFLSLSTITMNNQSSSTIIHPPTDQPSTYTYVPTSPEYHKNDAERLRKKFRDAIYVGNFDRVQRLLKNIIETDTFDISTVLLPYASRHVTPIGLAARRGHVKICQILVQVIKEYIIRQQCDEEWENMSLCPFSFEQPHISCKDCICFFIDWLQRNDTNEDVPHLISSSLLELYLPITNCQMYNSSLESNFCTLKISNSNTSACEQPLVITNDNVFIEKHTKIRTNKELEIVLSNPHFRKLTYHHSSTINTTNNPIMPPLISYVHLYSLFNRLDGENRSALSHACEKGQMSIIEYLLIQSGIDIEAGGKHHEECWTNLHWACRYGHAHIVQLLLDNRAQINAQTSKKKSTGLHLACATGHTDVIHTLLDNGAAKDIEDVYGCSPLSLAIHFGEKKVQQILYEAGIFVSAHDARRLKKENHIFRRFGWIKIAPSIKTDIILPDDVWCLICGFMPCRELLLNVRLVAFGLLYVVHHPALRKLVNFRKSLPDDDDERIQYNESHQTLVLKVPSDNYLNNIPPFVPVLPPFNALGFGLPMNAPQINAIPVMINNPLFNNPIFPPLPTITNAAFQINDRQHSSAFGSISNVYYPQQMMYDNRAPEEEKQYLMLNTPPLPMDNNHNHRFTFPSRNINSISDATTVELSSSHDLSSDIISGPPITPSFMHSSSNNNNNNSSLQAIDEFLIQNNSHPTFEDFVQSHARHELRREVGLSFEQPPDNNDELAQALFAAVNVNMHHPMISPLSIHNVLPPPPLTNNSEYFTAVNTSADKPQWEIEEEELMKRPWNVLHCEWLACAVNFGPSTLRKIRLTGENIISQPLIRVLSCLSFIVHLELAHFHAYRLSIMNLEYLARVSQLKMIRQLKVFPIIRNNTYKTAMIDARSVAIFISSVGSTALTLGIRYENVVIDDKYKSLLKEKENEIFMLTNDHDNNHNVDHCFEEDMIDFSECPSEIDMELLSSITWKSLFEYLPSTLRSLRLHFGKEDKLKSGAVSGLKNFESIKCFTLHGDPGLYGQIAEWSEVFQRWNKLRYIVLGHRNNSKELEVPKEILQALPPMLPELALNISVQSIPNVVWYLSNVVQCSHFLRINLHVVYKHKSDLYHTAINPYIIHCLTKFINLETAYLKCGMVTIKQIKRLLTNCKKLSFVGFGIDANDDDIQEKQFKILLEEFGFDKIVVKKKINWLIAVKSYDKLLLDPTRCIHPVLEAFDDKTCLVSNVQIKPQRTQSVVDMQSHIQPL